jgi:soluble cytochrome b562
MTLEEDQQKAAAAAASNAKNNLVVDGDETENIDKPKTFTGQQVEKMIKDRLRGMSGQIAELQAQIPKPKAPAKKVDEGELGDLRAEVDSLRKDRDAAKADAEAAKLDRLKSRLAKGKLPSWFDPSMLPGKDEDEINDAIESIVDEMKAEEDGIAETKKKKGFGGKLPKTPPAKRTGDEVMNDLLLARVGRTVLR